MPGATKFSALCFKCSKLKDDCMVMTPDRWICASCLKLWHEDTPEKWDGEPVVLPPPDPPMENACGEIPIGEPVMVRPLPKEEEQPIKRFTYSWKVEANGALTHHHVTEMMANLMSKSRNMRHWTQRCRRLLDRVDRFTWLGGLKLSDFLRWEEEEQERQKEIEELSLAMRLESDPERRLALKHRFFGLVYGGRASLCRPRSQS